ncbi:MAG TPA: amidohydrolase family protein [Devosiaceae bacterium]
MDNISPDQRKGAREDARPLAIVDAHHHLWDLRRFPYPWLAPEAPPRRFGDHSAIKRNFLPADYLKQFGRLELAGSVHVQANCGAEDPSEETAWLAELSRQCGVPQAAIGYSDLSAPDAEAVLAAHARYPITRGVRALVAFDTAGNWRFADRPHVLGERRFIQNAALLPDLGFSLDVVIVPEQLTEIADLAAELPDLAIIVNHLGTAEQHTETIWRENLVRLSHLPNVTMKLSGLWSIDRHWSPDRLRPFISHALATLGADRLMYGSNSPVEGLHCPVDRQVSVLSQLVCESDPGALDKIFSETARRVYRLAAIRA